MNTFKYAIAGAALALTPVMAQAATITSGDSGTNYDLLADSYSFDEDFGVGTAGGTLTYTFTNNDASTAAVTFFGVTVNQTNAAFTGGVDVDFGSFAVDVAEGQTMGASTDFLVASGETVTLSITYGTVFDVPPPGQTGPDSANIDFSIQAAIVPIPAAGLLLLTALGAAGALRRRKAAA